MEKIGFFKSLGLAEYESKVLLGLIRLSPVSVKELSEVSRVPQNKIYSILRRFISLGILSELPDKKYNLINLKSFIDKKISEKKENLKNIIQTSKEIKNLGGDEEVFFQLIRGQNATMDKIAELNKNSKREVLGVQRSWKVWGEGLRVMNKIIKNKVKVRLIGEIDGKTKNKAIEWKNVGCKIRAYNKKFGENPLRFTIFDNRIARITIGKPEIKDPRDYITLITTSESFIAILRKQFLEMWEECNGF
ncbi:MAG: helix-turn-helix domain-containing protein [archaeon]|nr:helix-turn-helix domain-containing protein [archaeon]